MKKPKIRKTRFKELGYWCVEPGCWSFVSLCDGSPSQVGPKYASEQELLADLERYARESWGLS